MAVRLDYQPLFGKMSPTREAAEIEPRWPFNQQTSPRQLVNFGALQQNIFEDFIDMVEVAMNLGCIL